MRTNLVEGTGFIRVAILAFSLAVINVPALIANETGRQKEALPNFDIRPTVAVSEVTAKADTSGTPKAVAAIETLQSRVRNVQVDRSAITGAPVFIRSTDQFLTGPAGRGGANNDAQLQAIPASDPHRAVKAFIDSRTDLFGHNSSILDSTRIRRDYVTAHSQMRTVVLEQQLDGIPIFEAFLQAHLTGKDELINISSTLLADPVQAAQTGTREEALRQGTTRLTAEKAIVVAAKNIGEAVTESDIKAIDTPAAVDQGQNFKTPGLSDISVHLTWLPINSSSMRLCWAVQFFSKNQNAMYLVLVDAFGGEPMVRHCLTDDIAPASYNVFTSDSPSPFSPGYSTLSSVQPALVNRTLVTLSALDTTASPNGWIDDGVIETRGNNVDAHTDTNADNSPDLPRPQTSGADRVFDFTLDLTQGPGTYKDAAVVNLFYWCNWMHDRLYQLGFTESAGNFQNNNFGKGGLGNDAVQADAQDGSGTNNANFSTPSDGSPGRMQMYVFSYPTPDRDGDLDAEIILHEYTHGLSNRLVGGGVGMSALQSRGMGEGWSDFYALSLLSQPGDDINGCYASGAYASYMLGGSFNQNYYYGIRRYPYTTDITKNPLTYKDIDPTQASAHTGIPRSTVIGNTANEVHNMGEVWCVTLWEARANLIAKHGYATGNELMLQLVTDGMKLSPANPTFVQARDAIIQADLVKTGGANRLALWTAFAKRGLGVDAYAPASSTATGVIEDYSQPDDLSVTPLIIMPSTGDIGGPFTPAVQTFTLTNTGTTALAWNAAKLQPWLTLSATSGSLEPSVSVTVTATLNTQANALAPGNYSDTITFTNASSSAVRTRKITLGIKPPRIAYFSLDSNPGWNTTGEWEFGHPTGQGGYNYGDPDPVNGATGSNVYGVNLSGDYSMAYGGPYYLTAGPFNLTGRFNTRLQFMRWLNSDYQPWVYATVEVSNNGTTWTQVWQNGSASIADSGWTQLQYDIASIADNQSSVYIRWGHRVGMTTGVFPYSGWNIDDVELLGTLSATTTPAVTLSPSATSVPLGKTVSFTVAASCSTNLGETGLESCNASGTPLTVLNSTAISTKYTGQTYSWTPTVSGTYYFFGYAKDSTLVQTTRTTPVTAITVAAQVEAPAFSQPPGTYRSGPTISISTATSNAIIRYTTDGSTPTSTIGTIYTGPITLTSTTTLKAIATTSGLIDSPVTTATYSIPKAPYGLNTLTSQTIVAGAIASFNASASGNPAPTYQWQVSTDGGIKWNNITNSALYIGATTSSLAIVSTTTSLSLNGNLYRYIATNSLGSATSNAATLTITVSTSGQPAFSIQPPDTTVTEGTILTLYGSATSATTITYQWYKDGAAISGATATTYTKALSALADSGLYKLVATNASGTTYSREATVTITAATPPVFILQPQGQAVYAGDSITLTATATGSPSPACQWSKNGTVIPGATGNTLALPNLTTAGNGDIYTVTATNTAGSATSSSATINVHPVDSGKALGISPATRTVGCGRVVYPIMLRSNSDWTATKSASWITLSATSGKNSKAIDITVAPNPLPVERTATITIGQQTHTLTQRAAGTAISELWAAGANDFGQLGDYRYPPLTYPALADTGVKTTAAGTYHTLYIKTDGTLWATGYNAFGQLGIGNNTSQTSPIQVATTNVKSVACGSYHSLFLNTDGTLRAMGYNNYGQLGDGTTTTRNTPVQIATNVASVAAGDYFTCYIKTDGTLWTTGQNNYGQLGDGTTTSHSTPTQVATDIKSVACGANHCLFLKNDGTLWGAGYNGFSQLGDGTTTDRSTPVQIAAGVVSMAGGTYHSFYIKTDTTLWAAGYNISNQLGINTSIRYYLPIQVATDVADVATRTSHSLFLKTDGSLWAVGDNTFYKLGDGTSISQITPVQIATNVSAAACGTQHTLYIKSDNTLWAVGDNSRGQLGYASPGTELRTTPVNVASEVLTAAAGDNHSLFIKNDGSVWTVGENSAGQLGNGTTVNRCDPAQIASNARAVYSGYSHSLLVKTDGTLQSFGKNLYGQLGEGSSTVLRALPVNIANNIAVAGGGYGHTFFIKNDGSLWATGYNYNGQLGNGSIVSITSPAQITTSVQNCAAGSYHSLFIKTDGTLWTFGNNSSGQLGNGTTTTSPTPTQVSGIWLAASAGQWHSLLIKSDNTAWSAGSNSYGQLGDTTNTSRYTPVQVLTGVQAIAAGQTFNLWLKSDHTLWAAGDGSSGQLARGTTSSTSTPTQIASNIQNVFAGGAHTLFIADGDIRTPAPTAPSLSSFTPTGITDGSTVTINGTGFTNTAAVYFNGVAATGFTISSSSQITATAPADLTAGKIVVNTFDGYVVSANSYTVGSSSSSSSSSSGSPQPPAPNPGGGGGGGAPTAAYLAALAAIALARGLSLWARRR